MIKKFVKEVGVPYPCLLGDMDTCSRFPTSRVPKTVVVDQAGKVRVLITENSASTVEVIGDIVRVLARRAGPHGKRGLAEICESRLQLPRGALTSNLPVGGLNCTPTFQSCSGWCLASKYFMTTSSDGGIPGSWKTRRRSREQRGGSWRPTHFDQAVRPARRMRYLYLCAVQDSRTRQPGNSRNSLGSSRQRVPHGSSAATQLRHPTFLDSSPAEGVEPHRLILLVGPGWLFPSMTRKISHETDRVLILASKCRIDMTNWGNEGA